MVRELEAKGTLMEALFEAQEIVDDDQSVRRALRRFFKSAGYRPETYLAREILEDPMCMVLDVRDRATRTGCP
jgi:FixJ family two-component response regulator